jgi:hypothetical protein
MPIPAMQNFEVPESERAATKVRALAVSQAGTVAVTRKNKLALSAKQGVRMMRPLTLLLSLSAALFLSTSASADNEQCLKYEVTVDGGQVLSYRCTTSLGGNSGDSQGGPSGAATQCATTYTGAVAQCRRQQGLANSKCLNTSETQYNQCLASANLTTVAPGSNGAKTAGNWSPCAGNPSCPVHPPVKATVPSNP